jgi:hypothetical protein
MERSRMVQQSKREYLESSYVRYRQSRRAEQQMILNEYVRVSPGPIPSPCRARPMRKQDRLEQISLG